MARGAIGIGRDDIFARAPQKGIGLVGQRIDLGEVEHHVDVAGDAGDHLKVVLRIADHEDKARHG